ncbi:hypothetical protein TNCV_604551 [Trichonephila clavipes]|nr:hypothetical protein TNCV_604551 [Trichonephila clavipes]
MAPWLRALVIPQLMDHKYAGTIDDVELVLDQLKGCAVFLSRRESVKGENPTSFPEENTTTPYSGFEPDPTRLQADGHIHHTVWAANYIDEAHFWLKGYVNKQNCRIWSEANPQVYVETPLHPEKLTVWCALWAGGILLQKR